jgi:acetyltransferase-like isoleucine patch superfamily enzyme
MKGVDLYTLMRDQRDRLFSRAVASSFREFGAGSHISLPVQVTGAAQISIGAGVLIGPGSWLVAAEPAARVEIGDGTGMSGYCVLSAAVAVTVGRDVLFGRNVHVSDHRHGIGSPGVPVRQQPLEDRRPVSIGDGAWLGQNTVILPGVDIGAGAVIGANSVVRDSVPAHSVAAGSPARVLRTLR